MRILNPFSLALGIKSNIPSSEERWNQNSPDKIEKGRINEWKIFGFSLDFLCRFLLPVGDTSQVCKSWFSASQIQPTRWIYQSSSSSSSSPPMGPCMLFHLACDPFMGDPDSQPCSGSDHNRFLHIAVIAIIVTIIVIIIVFIQVIIWWKNDISTSFFSFVTLHYMGLLGNLKCAQVKSPTVYLYLCNSSNLSSRSFSMLRQQVIFGQTTGAQFTNHKARSIAQ